MTRQIQEKVLFKLKGRAFSGFVPKKLKYELDTLLRYPVLQMCV
jgi:hypothetical protein